MSSSTKKRFFVANWKMQLSFNQACTFAQNHFEELAHLAKNSEREVILAPSFPSLQRLKQILKNSSVHISAQNVSRHTSGAYTGQVSAQSLREAGCTYCIIGHSESRKYQHESNVDIENKCKELLKNNIVPIICIGEPKNIYEEGDAYSFLAEQLSLVLQAIADFKHNVKHYIIAYEPIWAIGTGIVPEHDELSKTFAWLHKQCKNKTNAPFSLVYGGSVNPQNAADILHITHIDGFLIGGASLQINSLSDIIKTECSSTP